MLTLAIPPHRCRLTAFFSTVLVSTIACTGGPKGQRVQPEQLPTAQTRAQPTVQSPAAIVALGNDEFFVQCIAPLVDDQGQSHAVAFHEGTIRPFMEQFNTFFARSITSPIVHPNVSLVPQKIIYPTLPFRPAGSLQLLQELFAHPHVRLPRKERAIVLALVQWLSCDCPAWQTYKNKAYTQQYTRVYQLYQLLSQLYSHLAEVPRQHSTCTGNLVDWVQHQLHKTPPPAETRHDGSILHSLQQVTFFNLPKSNTPGV